MTSQQQQLADLKARIDRIDRKYAERGPASVPAPVPHDSYAEDWLGGDEIETAFGRHFETEKLYEAHARHGSAEIGALAHLPQDLLQTILGTDVSASSPDQWAFLDTETTGLAGGAGTCAFLVGVGRITPEGFRVRQFFMRDYAEEASLLDALARHLEPFRVLITYNGRAFDQPLLETRYRLNRARPPFPRMDHLDLLYGARRLWKLRFDSCRLMDLESLVLGVEREGDIPGALIPFVYFDYLRTRQSARILSVFHHNSIDILTLACLTGIVPYAFKDPANMSFRHPSEMAGVARWLRAAGDLEQACALFRRAACAGLPDELHFRTCWDIALLERQLGRREAAVEVWDGLASARNPFQIRALEELAKHHEHRVKDRARALELTRTALAHIDSPELRRREARLMKRLSTSKSGGLL